MHPKLSRNNTIDKVSKIFCYWKSLSVMYSTVYIPCIMWPPILSWNLRYYMFQWHAEMSIVYTEQYNLESTLAFILIFSPILLNYT